MKYTSNSTKQTHDIGKKIAKNLDSNIVGLVGNLGSGKTAITKGIGEYFGIKNITSPTFVVMKVYDTKKPKCKFKKLIHIDCYRLETYDALLDIGLIDYLENKENLIIIEWADKIKKYLPRDTIYINFQLGEDENERIITRC